MDKKVLIIDCDLASGKDNTALAIEDILTEFNVSYKTYSVCKNNMPKKIGSYTHTIITGSDADVYDDRDWIRKTELLIQKIQKRKIKILGICFGHQLLAKISRGVVLKGQTEIGIKKVVCQKKHLLFKGINKKYFFEYHYWHVKKPPMRAKIIAQNNTCIQAICYNKNTYGVQFHPEIGIVLGKRFNKDHKNTKSIESKLIKTYELERKKIFTNFLNM